MLSEVEVKELINGYPDCPVEKLLNTVHDYDGSEDKLEELYSLLKWIENHEEELAKLRRMVEER
jgi:hypothetical protein